jgi:CubicO group peptidase (beta-lactamase class C family)
VTLPSFTPATQLRVPIAILTACLSLSAFGQAPRPPLTPDQVTSIDNFVTQEMQREQIPGVAIGVYSRGRILLAKGYGLANVELNVPVTPETVFQSGSVGKQFVSAAIMMLVEEGKLSLDDSVTKYFPDAPATWKPILLKNLLSHTSGLSEYESEQYTKPGGPFNMRLDYTEDELVKKIEALPIENPPGDKWNYRNTNYVLLGVLIHQITGMPYADFLAQRIFKPLGMSSTRLISETDIIPNRASGYEIHDGRLKNQEWVSPTFNSTADGTLYFNVLDLAKWDEALYTTRLLKQSSLDRMWTVYPLNDGKPNPAGYGFAWIIGQQNGHKLIEHGGSWQGFTCRISRYPDDSLTVVVLTNLEAGHARPRIFASVIAGLAYAPLLPKKLVAVEDKQPWCAPLVRELLDRVAAGEDIRDWTAQNLTAQQSAERMKDMQRALSSIWPGGVLTLVQRDWNNGTVSSVYRLAKPGGDSRLIYFTPVPDAKFRIKEFAIAPDREYE